MCREVVTLALKRSRLSPSGGNASDIASHSWCRSIVTFSGTKNCGTSAAVSELPSSSGSTCIPWVIIWHLVALWSNPLPSSSLVVVVQVPLLKHWNVTSCASGKWYTRTAPWRSTLGVVWSKSSCLVQAVHLLFLKEQARLAGQYLCIIHDSVRWAYSQFTSSTLLLIILCVLKEVVLNVVPPKITMFQFKLNRIIL